jgi:hypothetical protein
MRLGLDLGPLRGVVRDESLVAARLRRVADATGRSALQQIRAL